jgi:hypothetical protein
MSWSPRAAIREQAAMNTKPTTEAEVRRIIVTPLVLKPRHFNPQCCFRPAQKKRPVDRER